CARSLLSLNRTGGNREKGGKMCGKSDAPKVNGVLPAPLFPLFSPVYAFDTYGLSPALGSFVPVSTVTVIGPWNWLFAGGGSGGRSQSSFIAASCWRMERRFQRCRTRFSVAAANRAPSGLNRKSDRTPEAGGSSVASSCHFSVSTRRT